MLKKRKEQERLTIKFIGKRLLKSNRLLTLYSFISVLIGTILLVEMFNLSLSATHTYENDMKALYGDVSRETFENKHACLFGWMPGERRMPSHVRCVMRAAARW